ncbi:uncharacterized protein LAESUDRAFT_756209 [Laetiporus sulphureus 93-53]|uniref:DUF6534 domain-containing protein n=1 Tax=Laetiporus sulphureus 93-53 TaxID=1314785 RepID=A0A165G8X8_9APHY|nr:uncharacterized protein LAESUDRAFT_756209 [Laetiporus sulphureus 93-53]KZT09995.1 hypothetical protein LAESUDRAFT_756209 [Laetiporus sulphureus 93-53]
MAAKDTLLAGPLILGMFFNWGLLGMLIVQVYIYHICFPRDRLTMKCFVYAVLACEIVQTGLLTADSFDNWVYGYGNIDALATFHNGWFSVPVICGVLSAGVQMFFAWRIYVLSRARLLVGAIVIVAFAQMSAAIASGVKLKLLPAAADQGQATPYIDAWLVGSVFTDIVIAVSMTYLLSRSKTGVKRSDAMLNQLIILVVETGSLTATIATIDLIVFNVTLKTYLHTCLVMMLSKLYSNTLLINFNNRARMLQSGEVISMSTFNAANHTFLSGSESKRTDSAIPSNAFHVEVTQEICTGDAQKAGMAFAPSDSTSSEFKDHHNHSVV